MTIVLRLDCWPDDSFYEVTPDYMEVWIDKELASRILRLSKVAQENDLYCAESFCWYPEFFREAYDDEGELLDKGQPVAVPSPILCVGSDEFWFNGYESGSNQGFSTEAVSINGRAPWSDKNVDLPGKCEERNLVNKMLLVELKFMVEQYLDAVEGTAYTTLAEDAQNLIKRIEGGEYD